MEGDKTPPPELNLDNLCATKILGKGATGTVFLINNSPNHPFALKVVEKSSSRHSSDKRAHHEISILNRLSTNNHPFLPHLIASSENKDFIYWAIPYCPGGDLNQLRYRQNDHVFSPAVIRFYLAEIICAIEHLHSQGIVYRDLKPENILVQQSGHVTLTDFDLSRDLVPIDHSAEDKPINKSFDGRKGVKKAKPARVSPVIRRNSEEYTSNQRSKSFVGTQEYVAPEVLRGEGHEFSVDWWAVGVLCYEMLYGTTPFKGKNRNETFQKILLSEPSLIGKHNALTDLIGKLLEKDPTRRLGYRRGACELKEHEFFQGLKWDLLTEVVRPPFLPLREEADVKGCGIDVREYFQKLKIPSSPLWSPSREEGGDNESLTEF